MQENLLQLKDDHANPGYRHRQIHPYLTQLGKRRILCEFGNIAGRLDDIQAFHDQNALIRELRKIWGADEGKAGKADRSLVSRWENELGFSRELILAAAPYAAEAKQPMAYLDKILADYREKGITTKPDTRKNTGKVLPAQNFEQRDYSDVPDEMMKDLAREMEAFRQENGGKSDA